MRKLKAEQRGILHAHYLTGRTVREIATATQRSESAVKMTLLRLREQLRQCIQRQLHPSSRTPTIHLHRIAHLSNACCICCKPCATRMTPPREPN